LALVYYILKKGYN